MNNQSKVARDYRDNLLMDKDNSILAAKANRDRYTQKQKNLRPYWGLSHLGSVNSEDALTWNVFRTLEVNKRLSSLESVLGELKKPRILYWTLAASPEAADLQFIVGDAIRQIDGRFERQMTEPDVAIASDDRFILIECKLSRPNEVPSHLWGAGKSPGPTFRAPCYFNENPHPFVARYDENLYKGKGYQLFRMAFYCHLIGSRLKLRPELVCLVNEKNWKTKEPSQDSAQQLWERFRNQIDPEKLDLRYCFWQQMRACIQADTTPRLAALQATLKEHICL